MSAERTPATPEGLAPRVPRHALFRVGCGVVEAARGLVVIPLLARALGPTDFGHFAVASVVWMLLHAVVISPFGEIVVRECARRPAEEPAILWAASRLQALLALACLPVAFAAGALLGGIATGVVATILSTSLLGSAAGTPSLALSVRLRGEWLMVARLVADTLFVAGVLVAFVAGSGMLGFALLYVGNTALVAALGVRFARRFVVARAGGVPLTRLLRFTAPLMGGSIVGAANRDLGVLLVALLGGAPLAGVYAAANRFVRVGLTVPGSIAGALLPGFAGADRGQLRVRLGAALGTSALVGLALAVGYWAAAPFVAALLGRHYDLAATLLPVLGLVVAAACVAQPLATALVAADHQGDVAWAEVGTIVLHGALVLASFARWGLTGAAWAAVLAAVVQAGALWLVARRRLAPAVQAGARAALSP